MLITGRALKSDELANSVVEYAATLLEKESLYDGPPAPLDPLFVQTSSKLCQELLGAMSLRKVLERNTRDNAAVCARLLRAARDELEYEARKLAIRNDKILQPVQIVSFGGVVTFSIGAINAIEKNRDPAAETYFVDFSQSGWLCIAAVLVLFYAGLMLTLRRKSLGIEEVEIKRQSDCLTSLLASVHPKWPEPDPAEISSDIY